MYGHVMYANIRNQGDTATLTSTSLSSLQYQCLQFYFLRGGSGVSFSLLGYHTSSGRYDPTLWQSNETHLVNQWIRVQKTLYISDPIYLIFQAKKLGKFVYFSPTIFFTNIVYYVVQIHLPVKLKSMTSP